jgi:rSAM/selenodomain-associated transferase 2
MDGAVRLSIVIPTLNEAERIEPVLESVEGQGGDVEAIVADGGSTDGTPARVNGGARLVRSSKGRAVQMNAGAAAATGDVLLFLHADTTLPEGAADRVRAAAGAGFVGGCFLNRFRGAGWAGRLFDPFRDLRTRILGEFYGDNAIFVRRRVFERIGGFRPLPVMEDYDLAVRMRRHGPLRVIPVRVLTSARRFEKNGWIRQTLRNQWIKIAYRMRWNLDGLYE